LLWSEYNYRHVLEWNYKKKPSVINSQENYFLIHVFDNSVLRERTALHRFTNIAE